MSSTTPQSLPFLNLVSQYHQKEVQKTHVYGSTWSGPYTSTTAVSSSFHPAVTNNSPHIATPYLDSSMDEALSPACFSPYQTTSPNLGYPSRYHHHYRNHQQADIAVAPYIDQTTSNTEGNGEPIFTGDPKELLIDKSKAVNTSPAFFASDDIQTPLFGPIMSSFDSGSGQQYQQGQQQPGSGTLSHDHGFAIAVDWPCYNEDGLLFHALGGFNEMPTETSSCHYDPKNDQPHKMNESTAPSSPVNDQKSSNQNQPVHSTNANHNNKENNKKSTSKIGSNGNNIKRRRKNSNTSTYSSDSSEPEQPKRRKAAAKTNEAEKKYGCPICRRKFSRRYNLHTHIRTHNVNRIKEFSCSSCGHSFDRKHDRDRHMESVHFGKKSYKCLTCNAAFCRRDALSRHSVKFHGPA